MSQGWRWSTACLLGMQMVGLTGCTGGRTAALAGPGESLVADLGTSESPRLARLQQAEAPRLQAPVASGPVLSAPIPAVGVPAGVPATKASLTVPPPPGGATQTSLVGPRAHRITVRAWVNGQAIFDEEVMQNISPSILRSLAGMPEPQRSEKLAEVFNQTLEQIIEQEVIYQDAVHKLEKFQPKSLEKLKTAAAEDFEKQLNKIRSEGKAKEEAIKEFQREMRRQTERSFIAMEYMRSRVFPLLQIPYQDIKDYYDAHVNEFTKVESVKWQDVFIAVGPKHPTLAEARRFAEDLIAQCRTSADFAKLSAQDDGDSKFRGGEGLGSRRGEIRPAELEAPLFKLRDGEIGPVVELSTGVHIFRLIARDPGGQQPLNEAVQAQIRSKLRAQLADREYKRIIRELRSRSIIEIVASGN